LRKQYATNSGQPDSVVFFIDRSLGGKVVAETLRKAGARVEIHDSHFSQDARDEEWLSVAGSKKWVVLTKDYKIRYRETERLALLDAGVRAFVLTAKDLTGSEIGKVFVKSLRKIYRIINTHQGPFIARITRGGDVSILVEKGIKKIQ